MLCVSNYVFVRGFFFLNGMIKLNFTQLKNTRFFFNFPLPFFFTVDLKNFNTQI